MGVGSGQRNRVRPRIVIGVGRVLLGGVVAVPEVPAPRSRIAGGLIGEAHPQRGGARDRRTSEFRGWRTAGGVVDGDVVAGPEPGSGVVLDIRLPRPVCRRARQVHEVIGGGIGVIEVVGQVFLDPVPPGFQLPRRLLQVVKVDLIREDLHVQRLRAVEDPVVGGEVRVAGEDEPFPDRRSGYGDVVHLDHLIGPATVGGGQGNGVGTGGGVGVGRVLQAGSVPIAKNPAPARGAVRGQVGEVDVERRTARGRRPGEIRYRRVAWRFGYADVVHLDHLIGSATVGGGQGHGVGTGGGVGVGRVLQDRGVPVPEVPGPARGAVRRQVGEVDVERVVSRSGGSRKVGHGKVAGIDGDVVDLGVDVRPPGTGHGQGYGVGAGGVVGIGRVLQGGRVPVPEDPVPRGDAPGGEIGEVHDQGFGSRGRTSGELGRRRLRGASDRSRGVHHAVSAVPVPARARLDVLDVDGRVLELVPHLSGRPRGIRRDYEPADTRRIGRGARRSVEP